MCCAGVLLCILSNLPKQWTTCRRANRVSAPRDVSLTFGGFVKKTSSQRNGAAATTEVFPSVQAFSTGLLDFASRSGLRDPPSPVEFFSLEVSGRDPGPGSETFSWPGLVVPVQPFANELRGRAVGRKRVERRGGPELSLPRNPDPTLCSFSSPKYFLSSRCLSKLSSV